MCCNKRTGTIIIGIVGIIYSTIILYLAISALVSVSNDRILNDDQKTIKIILIVVIGFSGLNIILNALLMYGAEQRSRYFLLPWLIYTGVGNFIVLVICVVFISQLPIGQFSANCISWALWAVVLRFYNELSNNRERSAAGNLNEEQTTNVEKGSPTVSYSPQRSISFKEDL